MIKSVHSTLTKICCEHIRELRKEIGMTQRQLADALNREHGMVGRIELGERRVDLPEAYQIITALGADPEKEVAKIMAKFKATNIDVFD